MVHTPTLIPPLAAKDQQSRCEQQSIEIFSSCSDVVLDTISGNENQDLGMVSTDVVQHLLSTRSQHVVYYNSIPPLAAAQPKQHCEQQSPYSYTSCSDVVLQQSRSNDISQALEYIVPDVDFCFMVNLLQQILVIQFILLLLQLLQPPLVPEYLVYYGHQQSYFVSQFLCSRLTSGIWMFQNNDCSHGLVFTDVVLADLMAIININLIHYFIFIIPYFIIWYLVYTLNMNIISI